MPLLRGNLHAHTTFSDGVRSQGEWSQESRPPIAVFCM